MTMIKCLKCRPTKTLRREKYDEMKMCKKDEESESENKIETREDHLQIHPLALNNAKRSKMLNFVSGYVFSLPFFYYYF